MVRSLSQIRFAALAALLLASCGVGEVQTDPVGAEPDESEVSVSGSQLFATFAADGDGRVSPVLSAPQGAGRAAMLLEVDGEASASALLEARAVRPDGSSGSWLRVTVTSAEGAYLTAYADLGDGATGAQLRLPGSLASSVRSLRWSATRLWAPAADPDALGSTTHALSGELANLGVVPRSSWTTAGASCSGDVAKYRMSVHNTASAAFTDAAGLRATRQHHVNLGYCDIAYHFVVTIDGTIWEGRSLASLGAHTLNQNSGSIGISLAGCFQPGACDGISSQQTPSDAMLASLSKLVGALGRTQGVAVDRAHVKGHREWNAGTACPGDNVMSRLDSVVAKAAGAQPPVVVVPPPSTATARYVGIAGGADGAGYWVAKSDGGVFSFAEAFHGSMGGRPLAQPVVAMTRTPSGKGYWLAAADGGIFGFGDAGFYGSLGAVRLNKPIVAVAATPTGKGYWLAASDGGVFAFGDAGFFGSLGSIKLNQPVVGMAATPSGKGYWLVAADGGIFAFGDAPFKGSLGSVKLNQPIVALAATPTGDGYWLVASDGGVFAFGDAPFKGSLGSVKLAAPITAMAATPTGKGYWMVANDGGVFSFGDAPFKGRP